MSVLSLAAVLFLGVPPAAYWARKYYLRSKLALFDKTLLLFQNWSYMETKRIEPLLKLLTTTALQCGLDRHRVAAELSAIIEDERHWKISEKFGHEDQAAANVNELLKSTIALDIPLDAEVVNSLYGRIAENITKRLESDWKLDDQKGYMTAKAALVPIHLAGRDHDLKPRILERIRYFGEKVLEVKVREAMPYAKEFKFIPLNEALTALAVFAQEAGVDSRPHIHLLQNAMRDALENVVGRLE